MLTRRALLQSTALVMLPFAASGRAAWAAAPDMGSVFPAGAVYFRKSNPPPSDWVRDYKTAADAGMNTFRHWFIWSAIEVAPGKYDWSDYDRQMDLAAANGIKTIIAIIDGAAPEWAFRKFAHAQYKASDDTILRSSEGVSSASGGYPGLCLDNADVKASCGAFITALVTRYRHHPALLGYDLWNETNFRGGTPQRMYCYCEASKTKLRDWTKSRYGTPAALGQAWHRYSFADWADVEPPRGFGGYAESLDWLQFRIDNAYDLFDWRIALVRKLDPKHLVTAHSDASTLTSYASGGCDEWRGARDVDVFGFTFVASRKGAAAWKQYQAVDLVRAGARGKPFWHAEATGGPLWMQLQLPGRPRDDGRISTPEDVRLWFLVSCAAGARGLLYTRWRGLLDDALFGAFGLYGMDGSSTPQAEMASKLIRWANAQPQLWQARPVQGEAGLLFVPESQLFNYVQQGSTDFYAASMQGAYQAFFDCGIQPDFVALDDIARYKLIYLPYPVMLSAATVDILKHYVANGGTLISEGLPGYFGDHGHVGTSQPNNGLDQLFGARETAVEFDPDLSENLTFTLGDATIHGRYFRQDYTAMGGTAVGHYPDGGIAAVENQSGQGRTLLMGSFPGAGYALHHDAATRALFAGFLARAGIRQQVLSSNPAVQARLHQGAGGQVVWATNATAMPQDVRITLDTGAFTKAREMWSDLPVKAEGRTLSFQLPPKDAAVIALG